MKEFDFSDFDVPKSSNRKGLVLLIMTPVIIMLLWVIMILIIKSKTDYSKVTYYNCHCFKDIDIEYPSMIKITDDYKLRYNIDSSYSKTTFLNRKIGVHSSSGETSFKTKEKCLLALNKYPKESIAKEKYKGEAVAYLENCYKSAINRFKYDSIDYKKLKKIYWILGFTEKEARENYNKGGYFISALEWCKNNDYEEYLKILNR